MSRRRRAGIIVLCLLAALVFIWLDHSSVNPALRSKPKSEERAKSSDFKKYHAKTFTVINVVDGDTIDINIPDGQYDHTRIRLWGVDTPETKSPKVGVMYYGPEASEFTKKVTLEKQVAIYLDKANPSRGKYGRLLAYVQLPDKTFLNETLLSEGFAYADTRFRHSFYNQYKQLEAAARSAKKGLWQNVTPNQWPQWRQRKKNR